MLVLALDTTSRRGSCALVREDRVLAEATGDESRPQATRLPGDLQALLTREGLSLADVDIFAVAVGPGSFTGLRVGIATMQGLAFAADKPLLGVSGLDALALLAEDDGGTGGASLETATWVDAWRGEVYAATYDGVREIEPVTVARPEDLLQRLRGPRTRFIGDGVPAHTALIAAALGERATFLPTLVPPLAGAIGRLAAARAATGERPMADTIEPLYVRRPDAELARDVRVPR